MMTHTACPTALTKYIRITGDPQAKFVEFDFAIQDPTLFVELVLPQQAFQEFCAMHQVVEMSAAQQAWNDAQEDKWRYGVEPSMVRPTQYLSDQEDQS